MRFQSSFLKNIAILMLVLTSLLGTRDSVFADEINLRMLDGVRRSAMFVGMNRDTITIRDDQGAGLSVPLLNLKSISFDRKFKESRERKIVIQLTNGDLFLADTISLFEDALIAEFSDQKLVLALEFVRNIFFETTIFQLAEIDVETPGNDTVSLNNGDVIRGELLFLKESEVEVSTELGKLKFPQSQVESITFDSELSAQVPMTDSSVQFFLKNGSVVTATRWQFDSKLNHFDVGLFASRRLKIKLTDLGRIEFWNPGILPMTRLIPIRFLSEDFFGTPQPFETNRSLSKQTLVCGRSVYTSGFAVRSRSNLVFKVPSNAETFVASLGFDDHIKKFGAVDVRVLVSGKVMWKDTLSHQQKPFVDVPSIPVQPQQELELQVDFGKQADIGDNLIWCQPYFVLQN